MDLYVTPSAAQLAEMKTEAFRRKHPLLYAAEKGDTMSKTKESTRFLTEEDAIWLRELAVRVDAGDRLQIRAWIRQPSGDCYGRDDFNSLLEVQAWAQRWMLPGDVLNIRTNGGERPLPAADSLPLLTEDRLWLAAIGVSGDLH